jgi:hypothetical protein
LGERDDWAFLRKFANFSPFNAFGVENLKLSSALETRISKFVYGVEENNVDERKMCDTDSLD